MVGNEDRDDSEKVRLAHGANRCAEKVQLLASGCIVHEPGSRGYTQATGLHSGVVEREARLQRSLLQHEPDARGAVGRAGKWPPGVLTRDHRLNVN